MADLIGDLGNPQKVATAFEPVIDRVAEKFGAMLTATLQQVVAELPGAVGEVLAQYRLVVTLEKK